jgi:hypothetical protein
VLLCGETFDQAASAAGQRDDPAAVAMHFMDPAEDVAVERPDLGVPEVA